MDVPLEFSKLVRRARSITQEFNVLVRYGFAVVTVLVAVGLRFAFPRFLGTEAPYMPFGLAVIFSALLGGGGPGLAALVLSALAVDQFFLGPLHSLVVARPKAMWGLALFVVVAVPIALLMGVFRKLLLRVARTEEALRQQGQLIELSQDAVFTTDSEWRIITWNKGAEEMYGWPEKNAVGKIVQQLLQTASPVPLTEIDEILCREGRWEGELSRSARDGRRLVVDSRQVLIRGENGLPTRILAISRDITEHRRAEEALREKRNFEPWPTRSHSFAGQPGPTAGPLGSTSARMNTPAPRPNRWRGGAGSR